MRDKSILWNILTSGAGEGVGPDTSRKLMMTNAMLVAGMSILVYFVVTNSISRRWVLAAVDFGMIAALAAVFGLQRRRIASRVPTYLGLSALAFFVFYLLVFFEPRLHAYLWFFALPPLLLYLLGTVKGSIFFLCVYVALTLVMTGIVHALPTHYSSIFIATILLSLLATYVLSFFFEYTRSRTFGELQQRHRELERSLAEVRALSMELQESESIHRTLIESAADGIVLLNGENIVLANDRICRILGFSQDELVGESYVNYVDPAERSRLQEMYARRLRTGNAPELYETVLLNREGFRIPVEISAGLIHYQRRVADFVVVRDISTRKKVEDELKYFAYHDPLTSLPNRKALFEDLRQMIERRAAESSTCALMYLDLDGFKRVNDELGHEAGDHVLVTVAGRLRDSLRTSDNVYRIGGDEFVLLAPLLNQRTDAVSVAEKLIRSVSRPLEYDGNRCMISASVGICLFAPAGETSEQILRRADSAMFEAKQRHSGFEFASD